MSATRVFGRAATIAATVCLIGLVAWAGPFARSPTKISDTDRSLARIKRIELIVDPLPRQIHDVRLSVETIRKSIANDLRDAGYEIVTAEDAPKLGVLVSAVTDPKVPGGIAFTINMVLNQRATIERLDESLLVPTHAQVILGLEAKQNLRGAVKTTIDQMTDRWIRIVRVATANRD